MFLLDESTALSAHPERRPAIRQTAPILLNRRSDPPGLSPKHDHLTSKQIQAAVRKPLPAINLATVYRMLEGPARADQVSILNMGTGAVVAARVTVSLYPHVIRQDCSD